MERLDVLAGRPRRGALGAVGWNGDRALAGLDDGAGAGTLDAVPGTLAGFSGWRRAVEVFIVFFEGLGTISFTSTRRALRE